ncbi:ComEA family DNA-binding protein [Paenibacillus sp. SAF-054]|uniref:ComEA family DNA-binding protein n=1 Tax=unclassified Paenibacillus TaxID=185978 RepID=UPI003F7F6F5F
MKRWTAGISVCCALLGTAAILLSGMKPNGGIEAWQPLNARIASTLDAGQQPVKAQKASDQTAVKEKSEKSDHAQAETGKPESSISKAPAAAEETATLPAKPQPTAAGHVQPDAAAGNTADAPSAGTSAGKINVNSASASELTNIPGIGAKKAQAIIDYRNQHGPFQKVADLDKVKGIGAKMLEKMKPYVEL